MGILFSQYYRILMALAIIPGIILLVYIYRLDRIEREPLGVIVKLLILGALTTVAAIIGEQILFFILPRILTEGTVLYGLVEYFICVACVEEGVKYLALKNYTWRSPDFNYRFDAVVFAVTIGIGFAIAENISYALSYGIFNTLLRAVTAIPAHTIFAIFMGHFYGEAKFCWVRGDLAGCSRFRRLAFFIPVLLHGIYDFTASMGAAYGTLVFLAFIAVLYVVAFRRLHRYAREDQSIY